MSIYLKNVLSLLLIFLSGYAFSNEDRIKSIYFLEDQTSQLEFESIHNEPKEWKKNDTVKFLNFGFSNSAYWVRIQIDKKYSSGSYVLSVQFPLISELDIIQVNQNGSIQKIQTGFSREERYSDIPSSRHYHFKINSDEIFLRVKSVVPGQMPISIEETNEVIKNTTVSHMGFSALYAVLFLFSIYNFFIFIYLRDRSYLYYTGYSFSIMTIYLFMEGHLRLVFPDLSPEISSRLWFIVGWTNSISLALFCKKLLRLDEYFPKIAAFLRFQILAYLLILTAQLISDNPFYYLIVQISYVSLCLQCLVYGIISIKHEHIGLFFVLAFTAYIAGTVAYIFQLVGVLDQNFFTQHAIHFGSVVEVTVFSLALGYRINLVNNNLIKATDELKQEMNYRQKISEELETQRMIAAQSAKMGALGEMARNIAHEINSPLAVLKLKNENLRRSVDSFSTDDDTRKTLIRFGEGVEKTINRMTKTVHSLLKFSRNSAVDGVETTNLKELIEESVELCRVSYADRAVDLKISDFDERLTVDCNPTEISQVILNLLNNAYDAVAGVYSGESPWVAVDVEDYGDTLNLLVTDSGHGIPDEVVEKMMMPFFTTKERGKGTGVGLSLSSHLAEKNGGHLKYVKGYSNTRFCLQLKKGDQIPITTSAAS